MYFFFKLGRNVNQLVNPIDFGGHSSNVKVRMVIFGKCGVHRVKGQGHNGHMEISL